MHLSSFQRDTSAASQLPTPLLMLLSLFESIISLSTAVRAQLTYATTHLSSVPGVVCMRIADKPKGDTSVTNSVFYSDPMP